MWTRTSSRILQGTVAFFTLGALTSCLDLPIQGEVSGQSMEWVSMSVTVADPIVMVEGGADQTAAVSSAPAQVLLSDFRSACDDLAALATPADGLHTLALTLEPQDGEAIVEGVYRIGGPQQDEQGTVWASFLSGMLERVVQEDAVSGVLVITDALGPAMQGELHLQFPGGKLTGYFQSDGCSDALPDNG